MTADDRLEITVSDTGIGIPKDKLTGIFESFKQADASTSRVYGGTGLGLSITKQLIELHGGTIRAKSTVGKGSQFIFTLPVSREQMESTSKARVAGVCDESAVEVHCQQEIGGSLSIDSQSGPGTAVKITVKI